MKTYTGLDDLPRGTASRKITKGLLVLEGGAWRGMYTQGVLDAMMEDDLNLSAVIGVSAGALSGLSYVSGQIGRSIHLNLLYRHDPNYFGRGAILKDHGVTGFSYLFGKMSEEWPLDEDRFYDPNRRFVAVATNIDTGEAEYFEKGKCSDIFKAIQASATVPYVSEAVEIDGKRYLDGGIAQKIPLDWALEQPEEKIILIRTRDRNYRKPLKATNRVAKLEYGRKYPNLMYDLYEEQEHYNILISRIEQLEAAGRLFVLAPSQPVTISRFEGNIEELGNLYWLGYSDGKAATDAMKEYLAK
ncbi:MAG: patatin family protein [Solobacterium sp.]|nr:patatin family protein [Solobacterium sp.]MBR3347351.1 patatin family protein [Solobacterium sp.]